MLRLKTFAYLKETVIWLPGNSKHSIKITLFEEYDHRKLNYEENNGIM